MMDMEMLCRAVQETKPWIDDFRKRTYEKAFRAYTDRFGPSYVEAVREAGEEGLQRLAGEVLDGIEAGWKRPLESGGRPGDGEADGGGLPLSHAAGASGAPVQGPLRTASGRLGRPLAQRRLWNDHISGVEAGIPGHDHGHRAWKTAQR